MKRIVIAVDGYSACGKSTLAKQLARSLHYTYIDSGAMYRAITLFFIRERLSLQDKKAVQEALASIRLQWHQDGKSDRADLWMNGENVEDQIRGLQVASKVSEIAAMAEVRDFAVDAQRRMGREKGIVMDGRDIGTVVFPGAELKLFMTAELQIRVERRYREVLRNKEGISLEEVKENLISRDYLDTHRKISPLRQAEDAVVLDNSYLNEEEQLRYALDLVKKTLSLV